MNPTQLAAIIRYEIVMALRRRTPIILFLLAMGGMVVFCLIARDSLAESGIAIPQDAGRTMTFSDLTDPAQVPEEAIPVWLRDVDIIQFNGSSSIFIAVLAAVVLTVVGVVMFTNEVIPLDRQYKTRELLDAAPISRATYLAGKLGSVWLTIAAILPIVAIIGGIAARILIGVYDVRLYVLLWVAFGVPMLAIAASFAVLLSSAARSRRMAILLSLGVMPIMLIVLGTGVPSLGAVGVYLERAYQYFVLIPVDQDGVVVTSERIAGALPILAAALILPWLFAWGWARLREAR